MTPERASELAATAIETQLKTGQPVQLPAGLDLVWGWFCDLSLARSYHQAGPNPIPYSEIRAYADLYRIDIRPHHVSLIRAMDRAFVLHSLERSGAVDPKDAPKPPLSPKIFDMLFG